MTRDERAAQHAQRLPDARDATRLALAPVLPLVPWEPRCGVSRHGGAGSRPCSRMVLPVPGNAVELLRRVPDGTLRSRPAGGVAGGGCRGTVSLLPLWGTK